MKFQILKQGGVTLIAAPELVEHITPSWFNLNWWQAQGQQPDSAPGRGESYFLQFQDWSMVWRHYKRGGLIARFSRDRYLWTGLRSTRAYAEFQLTQTLYDQNLPVPRPLAAMVDRQGLGYRADLITERLPGVSSLADRLERNQSLPWDEVGATVARFHRAGLDHVDLNLRNILIDNEDRVFLIDFDRCRLRSPEQDWQQGNLQRLQRSFRKLFPERSLDAAWADFLQGYET